MTELFPDFAKVLKKNSWKFPRNNTKIVVKIFLEFSQIKPMARTIHQFNQTSTSACIIDRFDQNSATARIRGQNDQIQ